ncbi:hypothetical protein ACFE04_017081 [Oxalis oulophora]
MERRRLLLSSSSVCAITITVQIMLLIIACTAETTPTRKLVEEASNSAKSSSAKPVQLTDEKNKVIIDNGLFQVTFQKPKGQIIGIQYNGVPNLLEAHNEEMNRGYWDVVWHEAGMNVTYDKVSGTNYTVISNEKDNVEISFSRTWTTSYHGKLAPLNTDIRYIVRSGISGFYAYGIMEREKEWPDVKMDQIRIVFKLAMDKFHYMAVTDDRQRVMPNAQDRATGKPLAFPEAVLLTNPENPKFKGQVDDKYQYSVEDKDNKLHGWISNDPAPVGFWMITPSDEFRMGGPNKQDLTSHVGPTCLNMFTSTHYAGIETNTSYQVGEPWKKVFGPVLVYLNSLSDKDAYAKLWADAKRQMLVEVGSWPYDFPKSKDFPKKAQRGTVSGQLLVEDTYLGSKKFLGKSAYVGLAPPGEKRSWQIDSKGYQFWTQADNEGKFVIKNVRPGKYSLYGWVPGFIGDFKYERDITITEGCNIKLSVIDYKPPRNGPTLWEIGYPDRTAGEYFIPDPYPNLMNPLYKNHPDKFRQYGLWKKYSDIYRDHDLVYTVGVSNHTRDWFFAHVTRDTGYGSYEATTWQVKFRLGKLSKGNYTLQLALASANRAEVQVRFNNENQFIRGNPNSYSHRTTTGLIGEDNAIARHGIHGLYRLYSFGIESWRLRQGNNTMYLTQTREISPFKGVMYDYIRLEGPAARS